MNQKAKTTQDPKTAATTLAVDTYNKNKDLAVTDQDSYAQAGEVVKAVKLARKQVKSVYQPIIDRENAALKATRSEFKKYDEPLALLESTIKNRMGQFWEEQERERKRLEAEAQEEARKKAEATKLEEASKLEKMGEKEAAEEVLNSEVSVAPVTVDNRPKAEGISVRKTWHAEVIDKAALIKAVSEGKAPEQCLEPCMTVLNKMAVALQDGLSIPGVKPVSKTSVAGRA